MSSRSLESAVQKRSFATLQRLCCAGIGSPLVIPELLRELHRLVPSHFNDIQWVDANGQLAGHYADADGPDVAETQRIFFAEFQGRREFETGRGCAAMVRTPYPTAVDDFYRRDLVVDWRTFLRSDIYNLIGRPLGMYRRVQIKASENGCALGALQLNRTEKDPPFSPREYRLLEALAPFVAHALHPTEPLETPLVESADRGVIIASAQGRIEYLGSGAARLLRMAFSPRSPNAGFVHAGSLIALPEPVVRLCARVATIAVERLVEAPPVWYCRNTWGGFVFRAHPLTPVGDALATLKVAVVVRREEPLAMKLLRGMRELPLTARETRFCLLLAAGLPYAQIGARMNISEATATAHGRNVYAKLGVRNKLQLLEKLGAG